MTTKSTRRKILLFASVFALLATAFTAGVWWKVWIALVGVHGAFAVDDFMAPVLDVAFPLFFFSNLGGLILASHIQDLYIPQDETSVVGWIRLIVPVFVGSFLQAFAYGWAAVGMRNIWASRRSRSTIESNAAS